MSDEKPRQTDRTPYSDAFDKALEIAKIENGPINLGPTEKLEFYALYKQAWIGDVTGSRPGIWDFVGRAKWDAYSKFSTELKDNKDLTTEKDRVQEAEKQYVQKILKLLDGKHDQLDPAIQTQIQELTTLAENLNIK
ncbi:acyl CoA binding protein-domain-containing protein [Mycena vitilis]|nr:acyl CoA binding protein-domain-containing protein [Mycena vitilis]